MNTTTQKIWLITGVSSGLGKTLALTVCDRGDFVIGTFRQSEQATAFTNENSGQGRGFVLDLTKPEQIKDLTEQVKEQFGRLDVLVNNAGVGFAGAIEEASLDEVRQVFEANFFGLLNLTQQVLPLFRTQRSGHIIQISSQAGIKATPGFGIYNASKFALEGFSEALAAEVAPLGIRLTLVEPGPFRTDFAGRSFQQAASRIPDYDQTAGLFRARMDQLSGKQEGDPQKAAEAIWQLVQSEKSPLRMPLGKAAVMNIEAKLASVQQDLDAGRAIAEAAVY